MNINDKPPKQIYYKYNQFLRMLYINKISFTRDFNNTYHQDLFNNLYNPNMCMIIIEDMCLGIIINNHTAIKFDYIKNVCNKYSNVYYYPPYKCKIYRIDSGWDTSKWDYYSLLNSTNMFEHIAGKNIQQVRLQSDREGYTRYKNYIPFLEALSWNDNPTDTEEV